MNQSSSQTNATHGQALSMGIRLEEFIIEKVLGSGGFGITYLAQDSRLGRKVVVKENLPVQFCWREQSSLTVRPRSTEEEDLENYRYSLESFEREAATLAALDHPGIVKVLRSFEAFGTAYFVMPFVEGTAFDEVVRSRREHGHGFSMEELGGILWRVLDALAYLHDRGIYHRDIKPGNLLIAATGEPVLIDFGAARQRLTERSLTVIESAGYTPFEQLQTRGKVGPWSDLYALGATLFKAITGETPAKAADRIMDDPVVPLVSRSELHEYFSSRLLESIDKAMAPNAVNRFQSCEEWKMWVWSANSPAPVIPAAAPAYTRERAATLVAQAAAEKDAALAHSAARLGAWRAVISQHMSKIEGLLAEVPKQKAAASRDVQVGNRAEMETLTKALPQALAEFQTAANKLRSEIQPSEWGAGHLKQPLAAAVKDDTPESLAWFECQALVNQGEAWNQLNMRVQDAMYRLDGWLLLHDAHVKTLRIADAAISDKYVSGKQQAKIITELYEELKGVRFSGLNYKYLEGYVFAREYRSSMILLAVFCLIIAGLIGFGIYSAQTAKPLHGSQTGSNYHTLNVITPAPLAALAENAPIAEIRSRAEQGEKEAQFRLGKTYYDGKDVSKDDVEAVKWYRKAAEQGLATAQNYLGMCYHKGEGVRQDDVEAVKWFRESAGQGHGNAQYNLGVHYYAGEGVVQDKVEAVKWYRKAAEQGLAVAQVDLGLCYQDGLGVFKDEVEAVRWYRKAAEQGLAEAQNELGFCYHEGEGVPQDDVEAVKWFRKAAEQGHAIAQNTLGAHYQRGEGVPQDNVEAVRWYRKAAEQGDATAQDNLGHCYHRGEGVLQDEVEGVRWFRKAAEQGHAEAQNTLAICYDHGLGISQDYAEAVKWYHKAAEQGLAPAQNYLGMCYRDGVLVAKDDLEAVKWFRKAAEQKFAYAQFNLGRCYHNGEGVPPDDVEAASWYRKAAEQGFAEAQNRLGVRYGNGAGVPKDEVEAMKWYRKAAEQGDAKAQNNLGVCYHYGRGVLKDDVEAVKWYRKAAEQGLAVAQSRYGWCYHKGEGVRQDDVEAVSWFRKAAEQGHAEAQYRLGICYSYSVGLPKDIIEAAKWFILAAAQQDELSVKSLSNIEKEMTPEQIAEAHRRADEFK